MICGGIPPRTLSATNQLFVNSTVDELYELYKSLLVNVGGDTNLKALLSQLKDLAIDLNTILDALNPH